MEKEVRVRFAPSPTGALHIGGVRTALFNYLFAKKHGGKFILRIEDTDSKRFVDGAEEYITKALDWLGIAPDESPDKPGEFGPYRQSERKELYAPYAQQLIDAGHAYYAFDTSEEIEEMKERLKAARVVSPQYNVITRTQMKNSLTLSKEDVAKRLEAGDPYTIRFMMPRKEEIRFQDLIRGWVKVNSHEIDDKVLVKSDGMPTYHLANIVDDHLMKITHVIRGEEWLPSAPLHVMLYRALGWGDDMPEFAHLPLLMKPDGNGKLSKRDGDKLGFPVFPLNWQAAENEVWSGFKEEGYLPEALLNFLSLLGWNPGDAQEMFSKEELIEAFSLERVVKSGTKFDIDKARWFNQEYIKALPKEQLGEALLEVLKENGIECSLEKAADVCGALKGRVTYPNEFWSDGKYFFVRPTSYDEKVVRKKWTTTAVGVLTAYAELLPTIADFNGENAKDALAKLLEDEGVGMGQVMQALRVAVSGKGNGPDIVDILGVLGAEELSARILEAIDALKDQVKEK